MAKETFFEKLGAKIASIGKPKKSYDELVNELGVDLRMLETDFRSQITLEQRNLRFGNHMDKTQVASRLENACKSYLIVQEARRNLRDITSANGLYAAMNRLSDTLKRMNQLSGSSAKLNIDKFESRLEDVRMDAEDRTTGLKEDTPMEVKLPPDMISRLEQGETFENIMNSPTAVSSLPLDEPEEGDPLDKHAYEAMLRDTAKEVEGYGD